MAGQPRCGALWVKFNALHVCDGVGSGELSPVGATCSRARACPHLTLSHHSLHFCVQAILHRIQTREPVLNHYKWEEERIASEKYLENIMEYKRPADLPQRAPSRMMSGVVGPDPLDEEYQRKSRERLAGAVAGDDDMLGSLPRGRSGTLEPL